MRLLHAINCQKRPFYHQYCSPFSKCQSLRSYRYTNKCSKQLNNFIWFGVDITRVFLNREITRNISHREKFLNTKIYSQVFKTNPTYFCHCQLLYFRLNKTGNEIFSEQREFTDKIASAMLLFTYKTNFKMHKIAFLKTLDDIHAN